MLVSLKDSHKAEKIIKVHKSKNLDTIPPPPDTQKGGEGERERIIFTLYK